MPSYRIWVLAALSTLSNLTLALPSPQTKDDLGSINRAPNNPNAPIAAPISSLPHPFAGFQGVSSDDDKSPSPYPNGLYTCDGPDWRPNCSWRRSAWLSCRSDKGLSTAKAIGPDQGNFCTIYPTPDCSGQQYMVLGYPGVANLTYWEQYTHASWAVGSIRCYSETVFNTVYGSDSKSFMAGMDKQFPGFSVGTGVKDVYVYGLRAPTPH